MLASTCSWLMDYNEKKREAAGHCPIHDKTPLDALNLDKTEDGLKMDVSKSFFKDSKLDISAAEASSSKPEAECTCKPYVELIRLFYKI